MDFLSKYLAIELAANGISGFEIFFM